MTKRMPDAGRETVGPAEAARLLKCSRETVKNKIRRGYFGDDAGQAPDGHWWIYREQLTTDEVRQLRQENAALRRRVDELIDAQAASDARQREARNDLATALAMLGAHRQATDAYKRAAERSQRLTQGYKSLSEEERESAGEYKEAADQWMAVAAMHLDAMAERNMPDTPAEFDDLGR
jgi:hypothetical protein